MKPISFLPFLIAVSCIMGMFACRSAISDTPPAARIDSTKVQQITALMAHYYDEGRFNGTVLVADSGQIIYQAGWGIANVAKEIPMETSSQFYIASVAKQFTCMGIMMLESDGRLRYDDPLHTFFPDLPPWAKEVKVRHLMNHTSGIPDYYGMGIPRPGFTNADVYQALLEVEALDFSPNSQYAYSNSAYVLLSMIIEKVSGKSFKAFMESSIFQPLNMTHSLVLDPETPSMPDRSIGYTLDLQQDDYMFFTTGGGGIFSNVEDLFKWNQALYTEQLISPAQLQEAYTPVRLTNDSLSYYGFGWKLDPDNPMIVQHSGSLNGFRTFMRREMDQQNCIILLTNHSNIWLEEILMQISDILRGEALKSEER